MLRASAQPACSWCPNNTITVKSPFKRQFPHYISFMLVNQRFKWKCIHKAVQCPVRSATPLQTFQPVNALTGELLALESLLMTGTLLHCRDVSVLSFWETDDVCSAAVQDIPIISVIQMRSGFYLCSDNQLISHSAGWEKTWFWHAEMRNVQAISAVGEVPIY